MKIKKSNSKKDININNIEGYYCFYNLKRKTQMIKNIGPLIFFNREKHTRLVNEVAQKIYVEKQMYLKGVNKNRLEYSALLHDVGHTPYGHAGEEAINELFFSNNENYYSRYEIGSFKHNLNSAKRIGDYFNVDYKLGDHILIDSIIKHGSAFPKKFNFEIFPEEDILRQNRLFKLVKINSRSSIIKSFISEFLIKANFCKCISANTVANKNICHFCTGQKQKLCLYSSNVSKYSLSMYLAYPYPLTCEGTILYWADEIACICGDLFDTLIFLRRCCKKRINKSVLFLDFQSKMHLLETKYPDSEFLNIIKKCTAITADLKINYKNFRARIRRMLLNLDVTGSLISKLVSALQTEHIKNNEICLNFINGHCDLLFKLKGDYCDIFKQIKDIVYSEVHNVKRIELFNEVGKKRITYVAKMFFDNLNLFMKEYSKNYGSVGKRVYHDIGSSLYSIFMLKPATITKSQFIKHFETEFSNNLPIIKMNPESLIKTSSLGKYLINSDIKKKTIELFNREILNFIALLPEKTLDEYFKKKKYGLLHKRGIKMPKSLCK